MHDGVRRRLTASTSRGGGVLGTSLYDHFGTFTACVIAITVVYARSYRPCYWCRAA